MEKSRAEKLKRSSLKKVRTDRQVIRQTGDQTDRGSDRQAIRQTGDQTDRRSDRQAI